jgi:hypothetical protein
MVCSGKMEILIFALIASYNAYRQKEPVVAEPEETSNRQVAHLDGRPNTRQQEEKRKQGENR